MGAWKNFLRSWSQTPGIHASTMAVLIGVFCVMTICVSAIANLKSIMSHWGKDVQLTVYLKDEVKEAQISKVKSALDELGEFEKVNFISQEQAAQRFQKSMGSYSPKLFSDPAFGNPLPMSFEATLKKGLQSTIQYSRLVALAKSIQTFEGVEEVSYGQGWVENYAGFLKSFDYGSWALLLLLLVGSTLVIGNSIRSSIHQRRDEIEILELCGATGFRIRWPYIFEGAAMGGVAAGLALILTYGIFLWQKQIFGESLFLWGLESEISFLSGFDIFVMLLAGAAMGTVGSFMCVRGLATGWAAAERAGS